MQAMLTPAQKMEQSLGRLGKLAQKDARFQAVYNAKLKEYHKLLLKNKEENSF